MPATKDKNGTWISRFYYNDYEGNRKQKFKRGFKTKREAQEFEREFIAKIEYSPEMTFQSLYELYIDDIKNRVKETTYNLRKGVIENLILPFFKDYKVTDITPREVRSFQNILLEKDYKNSYLKLISIALSSVFTYAVNFHNLKENPCHKAGSIGNKKSHEMEIWTLEEFKKFAEKAIENYEIYTACSILFWTGMRIGELLALTSKDIDLESKVISVTKTYTKQKGKQIVTSPKTEGSIRNIAIDSNLVKIIQTYLKKLYNLNSEDRIFMYDATHFRRMLKKFAGDAGVKKIRIHDLRHSHASLLIHLNLNPLLISKRLGHEKVDTTLNIYSHLYPDSTKQMIDLLEKL